MNPHFSCRRASAQHGTGTVRPIRGRAAVPAAAGAVLRRRRPWEHAPLPRRLERRQGAGPRPARDHLHGRPRLRPAAVRSAHRRAAGAALTFLLTWGSVPCLYYGDEIGMRYVPGMPEVEGSICNPAYNRAGCRTPMQWDDGPNAGFSTADPSRLYLPVDPDPTRPTVAAQERIPTPRSTSSSDSSPCASRHPRSAREWPPACSTRATLRVPPGRDASGRRQPATRPGNTRLRRALRRHTPARQRDLGRSRHPERRRIRLRDLRTTRVTPEPRPRLVAPTTDPRHLSAN
jgi:hypothetical protein